MQFEGLRKRCTRTAVEDPLAGMRDQPFDELEIVDVPAGSLGTLWEGLPAIPAPQREETPPAEGRGGAQPPARHDLDDSDADPFEGIE